MLIKKITEEQEKATMRLGKAFRHGNRLIILAAESLMKKAVGAALVWIKRGLAFSRWLHCFTHHFPEFAVFRAAIVDSGIISRGHEKHGLSLPSRALLIFVILNSGTAYAREETPPKPIFKLIQGQGTEVCEVYLQRLNVTEYLDNNPVKGRITEPLLKGFADLKPVPLTAEEIQRMYYKIISFNRYQHQDILEKIFEKKLNIRDAVGGIDPPQKLKENIKQYLEWDQQAPFVRYQILLDLDNDGIATNTAIKNNVSVYIVDPKLQRIDEDRMKAIFADQELLDWPAITGFPPLASPINVFSYNHKYYFDGFMNLALMPNYSALVFHDGILMLGVFIHEHYQTHKVCEFQWLNSFDSGAFTNSYYK